MVGLIKITFIANGFGNVILLGITWDGRFFLILSLAIKKLDISGDSPNPWDYKDWGLPHAENMVNQ